MDLLKRAVTRQGETLDLQPREFRLLEYLMRHAGQVVTPGELEQALWEDEYVEDPERVRAVIKSLRKALGEHGDGDVIRTVRGAGYALDAFAHAE